MKKKKHEIGFWVFSEPLLRLRRPSEKCSCDEKYFDASPSKIPDGDSEDFGFLMHLDLSLEKTTGNFPLALHSGLKDYDWRLEYCSLVCPHHSLIPFLCTSRFARAVRCAHSFARSLTHSLRSSWESDLCRWVECVDFIQFQPTVVPTLAHIILGCSTALVLEN